MSKLLNFIRDGYVRFLEAQQVRMADNFEGLPLLALLGLLCGFLAGGVIVIFRLAMEGSAGLLLPGGDIEGFEALSPALRFLLCVTGGLLVGLLLQYLPAKRRSVGVVHVIERLDYHQGRLPFRNALIQFIAGSISLVSGHSVGREGPSIHLGATSGSMLGRLLRVPNNSVRILVGSGVAAAIAAAFNTPLAGVIFAMEVVIMDYSVIGFTPVIIAAVSATTLTRITFGDDSALTIPEFTMDSVHEIPLVALMGASIGVISALFIQATVFTSTLFNDQPIWKRTVLAGVVTGAVAVMIPQIMGTGYDSVDLMLLGQIGLAGVILFTLAKILTTAAAIGLGIPAGLIGPTLFIGAAAGSSFAWLASGMVPNMADVGYYAMLGMAAMMAATLQAPLAALIYLLELTASQSVILPGMVAVVTASLVSRVGFGKSSIYRHLMLARGLDYRNTPMSKALRRIGVASVMERNTIQQSPKIDLHKAEELLKLEPRWILITHNESEHKNCILPATDLARHLSQYVDELAADESGQTHIDLLRIPAKREDTAAITIIATLQEAYEKMQASECNVLYITGAHGVTKQRIYGIITREHIESAYRV